jgi:hypothetical protein
MQVCTRFLSRLPFSFAIFCAVAFVPAWSFAKPVIYIPWDALGLYPAILEPSTLLGHAGLSLYGSAASPGQGGSSFALTGAFPFSTGPSPRSSGWAFGAAAELSDYTFSDGAVLAPSHNSFEFMLGRGTTDTEILDHSGLRGYLEFAYRRQTLRRSQGLDDKLQALNMPLANKGHFLILRMGTARDIAGLGLVEQKAPKLGWALHLAYYWPLVVSVPALITAQNTLELACGSAFRCGLELFLAHSWASHAALSVQTLENEFFVGPRVQFRVEGRYTAELKVEWGVLTSHNSFVAGGWIPRGALSTTIAF